MSSVLITGCNGYVGVEMCNKFRQHGWQVYGIDMCPPHGNQEGLLHKFVCSPVQELTAKTVPSVDAVIHLAGASRIVDTFPESYYYENNVDSTQCLRALYPDTPIYLASTTGMFNESREIEHKHPYTSSKAMAEKYADVVFRMGTIVGANINGDYHGVADLMLHSALTKGNITVAQGDKWRPLAGLNFICNTYFQYVSSGTILKPNGFQTWKHLWETCVTVEQISTAIYDMLWNKDSFGTRPEDAGPVEPVGRIFQEDLKGIEKKAPVISSIPPDYVEEDSPLYTTRLYRVITECIERYEMFVKPKQNKGD